MVVFTSLVFLACGDQRGPSPDDGAGVSTTSSSSDTLPIDPSTGADVGTGGTTTAVPDLITTGPETSGAPLEPTTDDSGADTTGGADDTAGTSTGATTGPVDGTGSTGEPGPPSFKVDMWPLVFPECGCHVDENAAGDLWLGKKVAYDNLVGKPSKQADDMLLIDPGSPETSYVWHKLQGTHEDVDGGDGKLMPPGGSLEPEELDLFRAWIEQGALP